MTRIHHRKRGHDAVTHIALWPRGRPVSNSDGLHQEAAVSGFDYSLAGRHDGKGYRSRVETSGRQYEHPRTT